MICQILPMMLASVLLIAGLAACNDDNAISHSTEAGIQSSDREIKDAHDHGDSAPDHHDESEEGDHEANDHATDDHGSDDDDTHGHEGDGHKVDNHEVDSHAGERIIKLSAEQVEEFGFAVTMARVGMLGSSFTLPAEVRYNGDRLAHVVPRVPGIVTEVRASQGDTVEAGQVLALLESRELADAKAAYLAAIEREQLAQALFDREQRLWNEQITSEQAFLDARTALAETQITRRVAEQKLHALGFDDSFLRRIPQEKETRLTLYRLTAPFGGQVIERHITLGESIGAAQQAFVLADLSSLWIDLSIFPKDLDRVRNDQSVEILADDGSVLARDTIDFITPQVREETRTATARIVTEATDGRLRPGMFVTARLQERAGERALVVPKGALQTLDGETVVFVRTDLGFSAREVTTGREADDLVEITAGLLADTPIVSRGAFTLKAQLSKESFGDGHAH